MEKDASNSHHSNVWALVLLNTLVGQLVNT